MKRNWQTLRMLDLILICRKTQWTRSMLRELAHLQIELLSAPAATAADR